MQQFIPRTKEHNVVQHAELSIQFYSDFVSQWPTCGLYKDLWPGKLLSEIITDLNKADSNSCELLDRVRVAGLISFYNRLYIRLTGESYA